MVATLHAQHLVNPIHHHCQCRPTEAVTLEVMVDMVVMEDMAALLAQATLAPILATSVAAMVLVMAATIMAKLVNGFPKGLRKYYLIELRMLSICSYSFVEH